MNVKAVNSDPHFQSIGQASLGVVDDADPYAFWRRALELGGGRQLTRDQARSLQITTEPKCGFYRKRNKTGDDVAVAIWVDEETKSFTARAGDHVVDPDDIWTWVCSWPISHDDYEKVALTGVWPDALPVAEAVVGHNKPDDPHEAAKFEFEGERELAETFLKTPITTQDDADRAAVWSKKLGDLHNNVDKMFRAEKDPIVQAGRDVDDKFRWRNDIKDLATSLKRHLDRFLNEQRRLEEERQRRAREEADRIQREAEAAARKAAEADQQDERQRAAARAEADRLAAEAAAKEREAQEQKVSAGRTGARVSLRTFVDAEITDYPKLVEALRDRTEMKELVQSLANRAAKAGVDLPGMKIRSTQRAA